MARSKGTVDGSVAKHFVLYLGHIKGSDCFELAVTLLRSVNRDWTVSTKEKRGMFQPGTIKNWLTWGERHKGGIEKLDSPHYGKGPLLGKRGAARLLSKLGWTADRIKAQIAECPDVSRTRGGSGAVAKPFAEVAKLASQLPDPSDADLDALIGKAKAK